MNRIARSAKTVEIISIIGASSVVVCTIAAWLFAWLPPEETLSLVFGPVKSMPLLHRLWGLCVDSISLTLLLLGTFSFVQLMRRFQQGELFSLPIIQLFKKISIIALSWALFYPIRSLLLSVITSWHLRPELSLSIGTNDLIHILIFKGFVIITLLLQEGYKLQQERDLTI